jgi:MerR family transcriptional regulator, light-induced transcriptional regulator
MIRIGELARQTSISTQRLRAWELRYGLLRPQRTTGGLRLYDDADVARVVAMQRLLDSGLAPAEAAEQILAEDAQPAHAAELDAGAALHRARLLGAIDALDASRVHDELDAVLARLSVAAMLEQVVLPLMRELGVASSDALGIAREHLFTNAIRGRLHGLARSWDEGRGGRVLLACPPGEQHDLPLIMFGLALRERGMRIVYLGANTPIPAIRAALDELEPPARAVVLSAVHARRFEGVRASLRELAVVTSLRLAGRGATEAFARDVDADLLLGTPVEAARARW